MNLDVDIANRGSNPLGIDRNICANRLRYFHFGQRGLRFMCAPNRTHNDCAGGDDLKATQYSEAAISQRQIWILKKHVSRLACVIW